MPKDRITQAHQGYGFVEFIGEEDADYAIKVMNMIKLFGKPIRVNKVGWANHVLACISAKSFVVIYCGYLYVYQYILCLNIKVT